MQGKDLHFIIAAGVSNIMIPPIIDYFSACPPITVSLYESQVIAKLSNENDEIQPC